VRLPEEPGKSFELDRGELIVELSPTYLHNRVRYRIARHLDDFVQQHRLGGVTEENDFRLAPDIVRNPDVAFIATGTLNCLDLTSSPLEGVPSLAIGVVSPANSAQDMFTRVHQYRDAGCQAVWVFYPNAKAVVIHDSNGTREIAAPATLEEKDLFGGKRYALPLTSIFDEDLTR
jgi:Uma2 family endonuclease